MHSPAGAAPTLMWFRDDLRLTDNPALTWAAVRGPVVALFIFETIHDARSLGAAAQWWQRRSLAQLQEALRTHNVPLILAAGDPRVVVPDVVTRIGARGAAWNRRYHLPLRDVDAQLQRQLADSGVEVSSHAGYLLNEPWTVHTGSGTPFRVFTPYGKAAQQRLTDSPPQPLPAPEIGGIDVADALDGGDYLVEESALSSSEDPFWAADTLAVHCTPGEPAAQQRSAEFLEQLAAGHSYRDLNDVPSAHATSGLSAYLRFGELSPGQVWVDTTHFADAARTNQTNVAADAWAFLRQLLWRDFAWHRLYYLPELATKNVREQFDAFPWAWSDNATPGSTPFAFADPAMEPKGADDGQHLEQLAMWQRGETGVPLVDAGMRELWATGTMHNRVRMVAGSWLTKNLGIHWRHGEEWFWDTLVDADCASNPFNWQWVAGCGDDAAPYFRIFNPLLQQEKFDPQGEYVRRWIPELNTPMYPEPMADVKESRKVALAAYDDVKNAHES